MQFITFTYLYYVVERQTFPPSTFDMLNIKSFYCKNFPSDSLGLEINPAASFDGLYKVLLNRGDVYEYVGVSDSLVRERLFSELSDLSGKSYSEIYNMWLNA